MIISYIKSAIIKYFVLLALLCIALFYTKEGKTFHILIYLSVLLFIFIYDFRKVMSKKSIESSVLIKKFDDIKKCNLEASFASETIESLSDIRGSGEHNINVFIEKLSHIRSELKMKNEEFEALREALGIITSTFDVKIIVEYIYGTFNKFLGCDRYLICFADKEENLIFKYEYGNTNLNETGKIVDKDSIITKSFQERKTILNCNVYINSRGIKGDKLAIPLNVSGEITGVIFIESSQPGAFEKVNLYFVESLAAYVAIAIKNAELFNSTYEQKQEIVALYEQAAAVNEELSTYVDELNKTKEELKSKNDELVGFYNEIQTGYIQTVMALSNSIEAKDAYTGGHCQRVMEISCEIGTRLGLSESEIQDLRYVAILHDIGKIGISASILNKEGKLTNEEFMEIKKHPLIAYNILKDVEFIKNGLDGVLQHHERFDGEGYPYGIKGKEICLLGRILCIADAFDAMTSDRPYRKGMPMEAAIAEIERCRGSQFDPEIADLFVRMSREIINTQ